MRSLLCAAPLLAGFNWHGLLSCLQAFAIHAPHLRQKTIDRRATLVWVGWILAQTPFCTMEFSQALSSIRGALALECNDLDSDWCIQSFVMHSLARFVAAVTVATLSDRVIFKSFLG